MRIKLFIISLVTIALFQFCIQPTSTVLTEAAPESVGMSSERLDTLDSFIQRYIDNNWLPGGVFLVARKGKIVYYKNFGYRSDKKDSPYQKDDIFRIASMTKAITTVSTMQLYERGMLGLDDPVYRYIPAFKESRVLDTFNKTDSSYTTVPVKKPITIRNLLTHTSGITYGSFNPGKIKAVYAKHGILDVGLSHNEWTTEEFINRLAKVPLVFQPGEKYMYGLNMDVLGRVIEVVSGLPLNQYFKKNIFEPLGMKDTYFYLPENKYGRLAPIYSEPEKGKFQMAESTGISASLEYPKNKDIGHYAGGGGLSSTAMDYATFIQALANNGEYNGFRLLSRKTIEVMTSDQMILLNEQGKGFSKIPGMTYGLGFYLLESEANGIDSRSPGTFGWGGYFNTKFFIDPQEALIFVGMTQVVGYRHGEVWDRINAIIYGAIDD
ncbi:Beta-lactamase class C-like and penicillin binding proteins (PBPs) superfamily [hydrothermal vent metagenome]|uniref:Beta-lactamase class C-like and penicillin binding proteins (PBPs) superfamily n=1 Tax=hydrothermal vent metagenome TaxID=652676 RepID=A0A3B0TZP2_9ZZZZ